MVAGPARLSSTWLLAITVGFLGAFTTFSTFSFETQTLLRTGRGSAALVYVALSMTSGVTAAALGYAMGRALVE